MIRTLSTFDPLTDIQRMSATLDRLFGEAPKPTGNSNWMVPVDIFEADGNLVVRASVPGLAPEEIDLSIEDFVLTIKGSTRHEQEYKDAKVYRRELSAGSFTRSIRLPDNVDVDNVNAAFSNGMLTVTLPKLIEQKPEAKKIAIRTADVPSINANN